MEIREILRLWLAGRGLREIARMSGADRKTVRRYVDRACACGLDRDGEIAQLTDGLLAAVIAGARPSRPNGKSEAWEIIAGQHEQIKEWLDDGLTVTRVHTLLGCRGVVVSYRTLHRYVTTELDFGRRKTTVRVADCDPGAEVQVDFGRLGMLTDAADGRRRVVQGLIFIAVYSRHMFVWPTYRQTLGDVIAGFEAAWAFFGGVFAVVIPDNMKAIVDRADATDPRLKDTFCEYARARGFAIDPTRIRSTKSKPRVELMVQYVRDNFFAGEDFRDLGDCRARAEYWCGKVAGMRVHSTTRLRPADVFATDELPKLKPVSEEVFDIPVWTHPKVAPDRHVQVAKALYSVPGDLVGRRLDACADARTVKLYWRDELIKIHPVMPPGRRHTDPADMPAEVSVCAMYDLNMLQRKASAHGEHVGMYAAAMLEHPLPWNKMRHVYWLLGLVRRHGAEAVDDACRRALDAKAIDAGLIERILTRGVGEQLPLLSAPPAASRFVRAATDFAVRRSS
ncbi:IS21 family transposase [Mycobacterium haemophilum DSM 44634]|nr:IS21 family transposase [Mycobacterium haemophilum DSM 44634]